MTALSYNNWHSLSDTALTEQIGDFVKHHRLEQKQNAGQAGACCRYKPFDPKPARKREDSYTGYTDSGAESAGQVTCDGFLYGTTKHQSPRHGYPGTGEKKKSQK